jgi:hypothetical protein
VVPSCITESANLVSNVVSNGNIIPAVVASTQVSTTINDGIIIIYGTRAARSAAGIRPYTNIISVANSGRLSSAASGLSSAVSSPFTWAGIGISIYGDVTIYQNGEYTDSQLAGAVIVDVGAGVTAAAVGGAVTGAITGTLVAGSTTMGLGAFPGLVAGALVGGLVGTGVYLGINVVKPALVNGVSQGIDAYSDSIESIIRNGGSPPVVPWGY